MGVPLWERSERFRKAQVVGSIPFVGSKSRGLEGAVLTPEGREIASQPRKDFFARAAGRKREAASGRADASLGRLLA